MNNSARPKIIVDPNLRDNEWFVMSEYTFAYEGLRVFKLARIGSKKALNVFFASNGSKFGEDPRTKLNLPAIRHLLGFTVVSLN